MLVDDQKSKILNYNAFFRPRNKIWKNFVTATSKKNKYIQVNNTYLFAF